MKILVCIKQVPEPESTYFIDQSSRGLQPSGEPEFRMNRYDETAVEEAVQIKEAFPATTIDALSIGPARVESVIRRAMGMGADNGIRIATHADAFYDPFTLAGWIAAIARKGIYDLIFTGIMSEDMMQGQVGPLTAELISIPCATAVIFESLSPNSRMIRVERETEGGCREVVELKLPALLTIQSGMNKPRYPSLSNLLRANRQAIHTVKTETLDEPESRQSVLQLRIPAASRDGVFLEGSTEEKAYQLAEILRQRSLLRYSR